MCRIGLEENNTKVQQTIMMILMNYSTFVTASTACSVFSYRPDSGDILLHEAALMKELSSYTEISRVFYDGT